MIYPSMQHNYSFFHLEKAWVFKIVSQVLEYFKRLFGIFGYSNNHADPLNTHTTPPIQITI